MYKAKLRTAEEAVSIVKSGDWIDYAMFNGKPVVCDRALGARKEELKDIKIMAVTVPPIPEVSLKRVPKVKFLPITTSTSAFSPV